MDLPVGENIVVMLTIEAVDVTLMTEAELQKVVAPAIRRAIRVALDRSQVGVVVQLMG